MHSKLRSTLLVAALLGGGLSAVPDSAHAQYFGRNKVQYENFQFEVLQTEHFDIYYYPEEELAIEYAALMAERWYARLSRVLNHDLSNRQALILYASGPHFRQTNTLFGELGEGTGGVTEVFKRRVVLPFAGPLAETDHVLGHELVHAFQFDMTGSGGGVLVAGVPTALVAPLWFIEGMAEYLSIGPVDPHTAMWMRDAVRTELPDLAKLNDPRFFPYRYGQALWSYIAGRWGDDAVGRILKATRASGGNPAMAIQRILRVPADTVIADWHRAMRAYYLPLRDETDCAACVARPMITPKTGGGRLNVSPALSPDGKWVVFLSERDLFSIDMYLADAKTGKIRRRITNTAVSPHFESIQFIASAGSWDFEGRRFAFAGVRKGRPVLSILDVERNDTVEEIALEDIGEVFNPAWSPDGTKIAFAALTGGLTDLFIYDLAEGELNRLTNDAFAALHPAWSPDGQQIAFVTDRFTTGLSSLLYGNYRLALIDPVSGAIREVPGFETGRHTNPQWSPDGQSLYFISDQNGVPNLYRTVPQTGEIFQLTNLFTGVSGITALSPAMSVASQTGEIALTIYEQDDLLIYGMDDPEALLGQPVHEPFVIDAALLPPEDRITDDVVSLTTNAFYGLPRGETYESRRYKPKLSLDFIGQPTLAVGADRFGTFIGGGASLFWSDMLGGHKLATGLQVNGSFKDIAALVGYQNDVRRLNWGVIAQQVPFRSGYFQVSEGEFNGQTVLREDFVLFRQTNREVGGTVAYPFSRSQRVEFSGGFLNIDFDQEVESRFYDPFTGVLLADSTINLGAPNSLNIFQTSAALVYDNSLFGLTGPIVGQRYRIEASALTGSLELYQGLADVRKYVMPVWPFTLAFRVLHFGRYGPDEESTRLSPLFLGYDGLVRGYEFGSFTLNECTLEGCPVVDRLFGSKMLVGNAEVRFPLFGALGIGSGLFGFLPIDFVVFGDAGLAWCSDRVDDPQAVTPCTQGTGSAVGDQDNRAFFLGGDRKPVYSAGAGIRINLFGVAIIELDWVKPFSRPQKGSYIQFGFAPGF